MQEEIRDKMSEHNKDSLLIKKNEVSIKKGVNKILISAPHGFKHKRKGKDKVRDYLTWSIIKILTQLTNCHGIYINQDIDYDPNYDLKDNNYYNILKEYIKDNDIQYVIDLHAFKRKKGTDLDIGTNNYKNVSNDQDFIDNIKDILSKHEIGNITVDKVFKSSKNTICNRINNELKIKAIQIEIGDLCRKIGDNDNNISNIINALLDMINFIEKKDGELINKMNYDKNVQTVSKEIDFSSKYDKVLDIKPAFGYKRILPSFIPYNYVGLEIEVSVKFERDKYSFLQKLLNNIKILVGKNGYFVKDNTIIGDYGFEIVLDPLPVDEIYNLLSTLEEIIKFSKGLIEISKEKNCGIHLNFNKFDVSDINIAHKKLTAYLSEKNNYFEENIYKQFKFIWDFNDYYNYQKKIASKYLWVNYLDGKVIEIRNVKTSLKAIELTNFINKILSALYYDKIFSETEYQTFNSLNNFYDTALDKNNDLEVFDYINQNGFVIIGLKNNQPSILKLNDILTEQIKNEYLVEKV